MKDSKAAAQAIQDSESKELSSADYVQGIRLQDSHDASAAELYHAFRGNKVNPPYKEWVATWLIKCLHQGGFIGKIEGDILLVSFGLIPGEYELLGSTVKKRLLKYAENSRYLDIYPTDSGRPFTEIEADPNQAEMIKLQQKIVKKEKEALGKFLTYIDSVTSPISVFLDDLSEYGTIEEEKENGQIVKKYRPNQQTLTFSKPLNNIPMVSTVEKTVPLEFKEGGQKPLDGNMDGTTVKPDQPPGPIIAIRKNHSFLRTLFENTHFWHFMCLVAILIFIFSLFVAVLVHDQLETKRVYETAAKYRTFAEGHHMLGGKFSVDCSPKDYNRNLSENSYHNLDPKLFADDSGHVLGDLGSSEED